MPKRLKRFDAESVRVAWDVAADAYVQGQETGKDYYRYAFFGPEHVSMCGPLSGSRVLDLGCGSGYFAREMARGGAEVTAVDVSPQMLMHARRLEAEQPLGIKYLESDAAQLGDLVAPASFEMVTSCLALQDMPDVPGVLDQARRALRPGGRLVVSITHLPI